MRSSTTSVFALECQSKLTCQQANWGRKLPQTLRSIHQEYFRLLKSHFVHEQQEFRDSKMIAGDFGLMLVERDEAHQVLMPTGSGKYISGLQFKLRALLQDVAEFWKANASAVVDWISSSDALCLSCNAFYNITLDESSFRKLGLYFDTLCIADPLYLPADSNTATEMRSSSAPIEMRFLAFYFFTLNLERVFLADCDPPLAVLYAPLSYLNISDDESIEARACELGLQFVGELVAPGKGAKDFADLADLSDQVSEQQLLDLLRTEPIYRGISGDEILCFYDGLIMQDSFYKTRASALLRQLPSTSRLLLAMQGFAHKSMYWALHMEHECSLLPMARHAQDAITWSTYKRVLAMCGSQYADHTGISQEDAVVLALENPELQWLANVSVEDLIKLREMGFMEEMRALFRTSAAELRRTPTNDITRVWNLVTTDINDRLTAHAEEIVRKESEYKRSMKLSAGSLLLTVGLGVASVTLPAMLPFAIGSGLFSAVVGSRSLRDVVSQRFEHQRLIATEAKRPIAFLLELRERDKQGKLR